MSATYIGKFKMKTILKAIYFGVEGELAYGISGDSVNSSDFGFTPNVSVDVDINNRRAG